MTRLSRLFPCLPLVLSLATLTSCGNGDNGAPEAQAQPATKVKVTKVETKDYADKLEALGTLRALEAISLSATVTERVAEIFFEDGDQVKKGDLLVRLQDEEEVAILKASEAELAEQEREIKRLERLVSQGAVSEVRLEEYQTRREVAVRRIEEAQAQINDRQITAPYDGTLGFREVSVGALVTPSDLISTLDILDPVKLDFTVPETFLSDLKPGQEIAARTQTYPDRDFIGKVTQIDTRVNPVTRSITVRAEIPNKEDLLRPGMLMTTNLEKNPQSSPSIPERALVSVQSNHFVFVVENPDSEAPTVKRTPVEIGRRLPGYLEIPGGLEVGQTIVTDGIIGLADGATVDIIGQFEKPADPYSPSDASTSTAE